MKQFLKYSTVVILLSTYVVVGILGNINVLELLGLGSGHEHVQQSQNPLDKTARVYWTQHKHISVTVKIAFPTPCVLSSPEVPVRVEQVLGVVEHGSFRLKHLSYSSHASRAPPIS